MSQLEKLQSLFQKKILFYGNALNLKCVNEEAQDLDIPIVFSEWTFPFNDSRIQRKDYTFSELLENDKVSETQMTLDDEDKSKFVEQYICSYRELGN